MGLIYPQDLGKSFERGVFRKQWMPSIKPLVLLKSTTRATCPRLKGT